MADSSSVQRRARRRAAASEAETELPSAPAPAAAPAAADDDNDDDDDASPPSRTAGRRRMLLSRSRSPPRGGGERDARQRTSTRTSARVAQRLEAEHRPSAFAQCYASLRSLFLRSTDHYFLSRHQVAASTPLQMTLYFSTPYAVVWAVMNQYLYFWKSTFWEVPLVVAVVSPMVFWVWALLEPVRLMLGYVGNLHERVAWLGGFMVLSVFPQLVVHVYFIVGQKGIGWFALPIETAMSIIYLLLLGLQLLISYRTIRRLVAKAMADFHLQPVDLSI